VAADGAKNSPRSFGKTAKLSAVWDFGGRIVGQAAMFFVSIALARLLTPADFGITAAARFFVTLATRVTQLGLNVSLVRMKEIRPEHASSVFVANLVMGATAFIALYFTSPFIGRVFSSDDVAAVLPLSATVFLIAPFGAVPAAMLTRHLEYRMSTAIGLLDLIAGSLITLLLAYLDFGYWSLVWGALSGTVLSTAARLYASPWKISLRFSKSALRDTLGFGSGFQVKQLLTFGATNLDNVVVGRLLGVTSLGFYDKAYGLMKQLTDRLSFDGALMRIFAAISDEPERFRKALLKGTQATTILTFPLLWFCGVASDELVLVLFGAQWIAASGPFSALSAAGALRSAMRATHAANESLGLVWLQTLQQLAYAAMVVVGVAVGSRWGVTGAAVGVLPGVLVQLVFAVRLLTKHSQVTTRDLWLAIWPAVFKSAVMSAAVLGVRAGLHAAGLAPWLVLLMMVIVAGATYGALLLWTPFSSVAAVVGESVDDLVPWLRRWIVVGALRPLPESRIASVLDAGGTATDEKVAS
jgi:O-antigen/teichoic acid export membrane protein